jgi:hypothetical protein
LQVSSIVFISVISKDNTLWDLGLSLSIVNLTKGIKSGKIISKPRLAQLLIEDRLKEIQIENEPDWIAKLPVEIELKKIFELIPSFM